jgi:hypothetical protein
MKTVCVGSPWRSQGSLRLHRSADHLGAAGGADIRAEACDLFNLQLKERNSWLSMLPNTILCDRVAREAQVYHELNFVASPAWAIDMESGTSAETTRYVEELGVFRPEGA